MKLNKLKTVIYNFILDIKNYSIRVAFAHVPYLLLSNVEDMNQKSNTILYKVSYKKREKSIQRYLKSTLKALIVDYKEKQNNWDISPAKKNAPIWILWWQGMENAPDIIKLCTKSKQIFGGNQEVIVISEDNYKEYVDIPKDILDKVESGNITITQLSDILRVSLLAAHGGLWLDASILCVREFPQYVSESYFFTCKSADNDIENVSRNRWTGYAMGGAADNLIFSFVRDAFFTYCKEHDRFIDYFLIDHMIGVAYTELEVVKKIMDDVPENNGNKEKLSEYMNDVYDEKQFKEITKKDTFLCKIAWKREFNLYTEDGKQTFYGHLKKEIEG